MNPEFFVQYQTGSVLDKLLSNLGGLPKGVNYMVVGDPGVGKTTVTLDILANLKLHHPELRVLFISAEMNEIDLFVYVQRYPKFGDIDIFFAEKDLDNGRINAEIIPEILDTAWDVVLIDSFTELQGIMMDEMEINSKAAESFLLTLIKQHNKGQNQTQTHTTFLTIQQVTKSGMFVGSNRLKHMITAMMELRLDKKDNVFSNRYITFSKHRRGSVGVKLYYDLTQNSDVHYNEERFEADQQLNQERADLAEQLRQFTSRLDDVL